MILSLLLSSFLAATVTTVAGNGTPGYWDGPPGEAMFMHPTWLDVVVGPTGNSCDKGKSGEIFVIDRINQRIRRISEDGVVTTFPVSIGVPLPYGPKPLDFGTAFGGGILVEPQGAGCGCDIYARGVFVVSSGSQQVTLFAMDGRLASRDQLDIIDTGAQSVPMGIARTANGGNLNYFTPRESLYIADGGTHTIGRVGFVLSFEACPMTVRTPTTFAGSPGQAGFADGVGPAARFNTPRGVAATPDGTVYVTDAGNNAIRKITPDGTVTTIAEGLNTPSGIDVNEKGEIFVADTFNHVIRMVTTDGKVVTIAGQLGVSGYADGDAASALFNAPVGLKIAPDGSIVVADTGNNVIRRVTIK